MKNWLANLKYKMQIWMQGRNGNDELSRFLSILSIVLLVLTFIASLKLFYVLALASLIWSCFRSYSKNLLKRRKERDAYLRIRNKIKSKVFLYKKMWSERKTHRYLKCKKCGTVLRLPKGKSKIEVTCPKCRDSFTAKT